MLLSYAVYLLCFLFLLWGGRFAGFGDRYHEDFLSKDSTKSLCGIAALFIIFHHIAQEWPFYGVTHELEFFNDIGFLLVSVFFFTSGYGLTLSADRDPEYMKNFGRKRMLTVLVPFYVTNILFALNYIFIGKASAPKIIFGVLGLTQLNPYGWFPFVLFLFYLVFWFSRTRLKTAKARLWLYAGTTVFVIAAFSVMGHFAWWAGEPGWWLAPDGFAKADWWMQKRTLWFNWECWMNSSAGFVLGAATASCQDRIVAWFKKNYWLKLAAAVVLFAGSLIAFHAVRSRLGYYTENMGPDPGILQKFITGLSQQPVTVFFDVALFAGMMKFRTENRLSRFLGKFTYETYLLGLVALESFQFLEYTADGNGGWAAMAWQPFNWNLILYTLAVVPVTILAGFLENRLDGLLIRKLSAGLKNKKPRQTKKE